MNVRIEPLLHDPALSVSSEPLIGLAWVWRLRWATVMVQAGAVAVASVLLHLELPLALVSAVIAATAISNAVLGRHLSREDGSRGKLAGVLLTDVALHTLLLFWSGGASNPFSSFFVVHVAVAALLLGPRWAAALVGATSIAFAVLFLVPPERLGPHALHMATPMHLRGMWVAYALSAGFVAFFVSKVAKALRERERELLKLRDYTASVERVARLGTMATGAAHELGTPLSSIATSATELVEQMSRAGSSGDLVGEARQIREEVGRCRKIIDRLAAGAGHHVGEAPTESTFADLERAVRAELASRRAERVRFEGPAGERLTFPFRGLVQVIVNLVQNGIDATSRTDGSGPVVVTLTPSGREVAFQVRDRGAGIAREVMEKLGEPFVTTKAPGEGMGLGVYVAVAFARQMEGTLEFESTLGDGTSAVLRLPRCDASDPVPAP